MTGKHGLARTAPRRRDRKDELEMLKTKRNAYWAAVCGVFACAAAKSTALEASDFLLFNAGRVSLRPQLNIDEQYNDNIFYRDTDTVEDFVTMISPGLKAQIGTDLPGENRVSAQYTLNQLFYLDRSDQNATQHRFAFDLRYGTARTTLTGRDRVDLLSSVLGGGFGITGQKVDRFVMSDVYQLDYKLGGKTGIYGRAEHTLTDFEDDVRLFDRRRLEGTAGFEWRYSERTAFFGELFYGRNLLNDNASGFEPPDSTFFGSFLGVRGDFTERLTGRLKAGYESTSFSDGAEGGGGPAVDATLTFQATDRLALNLIYSRRQQVSMQFQRSSYVVDSVGLTATQILGSTGRFRLSAGATYEMLEYEPTPPFFIERSDSQFTGDIAATYFFETWLAARIAYQFETFSSSLPRTSVVDYTVNRVTLSLAIGF
jgi:hypothetical protein